MMNDSTTQLQAINSQWYLATSRVKDSLPIMKLQAGISTPCVKYRNHRIGVPNEVYYPLEYKVSEDCPVDENTQLAYDSRYNKT